MRFLASMIVLVLCLQIFVDSFDGFLDEKEVLRTHNKKGVAKYLKYKAGLYKPKTSEASERAKWQHRMRADDSLNFTVPVERYLTAQAFLRERSISKDGERAMTDEWTEVGPSANKEDGGRTRSIIIQGSTLYAGAVAGGVWKSYDGGLSWEPLADLLANIAISCMTVDPTDPDTIYAGTGEGYFNVDATRGLGIFVTRDAGATWSALSSTVNSNFHYVYDVALTSATTIYAATLTGIWKSTNGGTSFSNLTPGASNGFNDMVVFRNSGQDYIYAWRRTYGLYVSTNGGSTFTSPPTTPGSTTSQGIYWRGSIAVAPSNQATAYISYCDQYGTIQGVLKTTNFWSSSSNVLVTDSTTAGRLNAVILSNPYYSFANPLNSGRNCFNQNPGAGYPQGWYDNAIVVDPTNENTVFIGGIDLFRSTDGGANFQLASCWWCGSGSDYLHADIHELRFDPADNSTLYVGCDGGVFKTTNPRAATTTAVCNPGSNLAIQWTPLNEGYATLMFYHGTIGVSGMGQLVGGTQDNGSWKFAPSAPSGTEWTSIYGGDGGWTAVDPVNTGRVYVSTTQMSIYRFDTPNQNSPTTVLSPGDLSGGAGNFINPYVMDPNNPAILYTCNTAVYKTVDARVANPQWTSLGTMTGATGSGSVSAMAVAVDSSWLYIGDESGRFYRVQLPSGSPTRVGAGSLCSNCGSFSISGIHVHPTIANRVYVTVGSFGDSHLWQTSDNGNTWSQVSTGFTQIPDLPATDLFIVPTSINEFYLATDLGMMYSANGGSTWQYINQYGLANVPIYKLAYQSSSNKLFAFTHGRGAYQVTLTTSNTTGASEASTEVSSASSVSSTSTVGSTSEDGSTSPSSSSSSSDSISLGLLNNISVPETDNVILYAGIGAGGLCLCLCITAAIVTARNRKNKRSARSPSRGQSRQSRAIPMKQSSPNQQQPKKASVPPPYDFDPFATGTIVQAKWPGDGKYYAARIEEAKGGQYFVTYLEYGNKDWVPLSYLRS